MNDQIFLLLILAATGLAFDPRAFMTKRKRRRDYYREEYLKSEAWQRKR